jgi:hypothetical protein
MSLRKPGKNHAAVSHPTLDDNPLQQVLEAYLQHHPWETHFNIITKTKILK